MGSEEAEDVAIYVTTNLEELVDDEGRFDGRNTARRDKKNVCVSFALVVYRGKLPCHRWFRRQSRGWKKPAR